jgi:hypothetical protein
MSNVLEDNLERLIAPPSEIRRAMDYIHSCDVKWQNAMTQWKDRQDKLLSKVKSRVEGKPRDGSVNLKALALPPDDPDVKAVMQLKALVFQLADQKVVAAQVAYDLLDLQIQKLNADASSFEKELKARGELMDTDDHDRGFAMDEDDQAPASAPSMTASQHQQSLALQQKIQQAQAQIMSQVQQLQQQIAYQSQQESAAASEAASKASSSSSSSISQQKSSVTGTIKKPPTSATTPGAGGAHLAAHQVLNSQDRAASPSTFTLPMQGGGATHTTPSFTSTSLGNQATASSSSTFDGNKNNASLHSNPVRTQIPTLPIQQLSAGNGQQLSSSSESPFQQNSQSESSNRAGSSSSASASFTERKPGGGITINEGYISALSKLPPTPSAPTSLSANSATMPLQPVSSPPKPPQEQQIRSQTPLNPPSSSQRVSPGNPQPNVLDDSSSSSSSAAAASSVGEKRVQSTSTVNDAKGVSNSSSSSGNGDSQGDGPLYCICRRSAFGDMVACDVPKCPNGEWFHHECVKLSKKSAKKDDIFICPGCKASGSMPASIPKRSKRG